MTDNKNESDSNNWGSRQERRIINSLIGLPIALVIIFVSLWLDSKFKLLEYLSNYSGYILTLWEKVTIFWNKLIMSVRGGWLVHLLVLLGIWIVIDVLKSRLAAVETPESTVLVSESGFWEKWGGRITGNLIVIFDDVKSFLVWIIVLYTIFVSVLLNPTRELFGGLKIYYSRFVQNQLWLINGLCGLVAIGFVWFAISTIKGHFSVESTAQRKRPKFFEEMQETLESILRPMGFEEKEGPAGLTRGITFSRDQLVVDFWYDFRDQIFFVDASSKYSLEEREKRMEAVIAKSKAGGEFDQTGYATFNVKDFSVEGTILDADTFKSNSISKLHRWLAEHNVSIGSEYLTENND